MIACDCIWLQLKAKEDEVISLTSVHTTLKSQYGVRAVGQAGRGKDRFSPRPGHIL